LIWIPRPTGCASSFWINPFGHVTRIVSITVDPRSPNTSGTPPYVCF